MCDMTHSYVWHDSLIRGTWSIRVCSIPHSYVQHASFTIGEWLAIVPLGFDYFIKTKKADRSTEGASLRIGNRSPLVWFANGCSVLPCVAVCCRVLRCVAVCLQCVCSVLQCVAVCCSVLQCDIQVSELQTDCLSFDLQIVAVCCSALQQCVACVAPETDCLSSNFQIKRKCGLYVWHDSLIRETWLVYIRDMTHSSPVDLQMVSIRGTWLIHMWDMTHSCEWHGSLLWAVWFTNMFYTS